jgi:deoxyribodipyrimidine photo-lyase
MHGQKNWPRPDICTIMQEGGLPRSGFTRCSCPGNWALTFFLRHLLDGDAASNTLSCRWVVGLHSVGKTYLARAENIQRFTNGRFAPKGLAQVAPPLNDTASTMTPKIIDAPNRYLDERKTGL